MGLFGKKKKKKKPEMLISPPVTVTKERKFQSSFSTRKGIPYLHEWKYMTASVYDYGSNNRDDLKLIDRYLEEYHKQTDEWDKLALGQLYFIIDHWLKSNKNTGSTAVQAHQQEVFDLFREVVDKMCEMFDVPVNYLPQMLEEYWGRILGHHGHQVDFQDDPVWDGIQWQYPRLKPGVTPKVAEYLSRAEVEKYKLIFENGIALQTTWWNGVPYTRVAAESSRVGWEDGRGVTAPQMMEKDYAGFAMSMGREIYMAHHRGSFDKGNFFHSSYLSGDTVMCTGTMLIRGGRVKAIKNDSGHYRPTLEHLLNVVQALEMYGVPPRTIEVIAVANSWLYDDGTNGTTELRILGDVLLQSRGRGLGLWFRNESHKKQLQGRGGFTTNPI